MDAFAVALSTGLRLRCADMGQTMRLAGVFGAFQFFMPVLGWLLGVRAQRYIENYDHWLAFALLLFVGGRMLKEAWTEAHKEEEDYCACPDPTRGGSLWLLGIATSIDALAVGLSFALLNVDVWLPAVIIGVVCFMLTALGLHLGRLACRLPGLNSLGNKANILGGLTLLCIGIKILHEHGVFS